MRSWSRRLKRRAPDSVDETSAGKRNSISDPPVPVWVAHSPTPDDFTDDGESATSLTSSSPPYAEREDNANKGSIKDRLRSLIPQSWGGVVPKRTHDDAASSYAERSTPSTPRVQILPNGTRVSPPVSPFTERKNWEENSSQNSQKPLLNESRTGERLGRGSPDESLLTGLNPAEYYAEKLEVYKQKYSYLKSWPGLLRLLAGLQLLFGGMVFACVIAYIQKDSEWSNLYNGVYNNGFGVSGYSYRGPMTPFILAVAGVSWIMTLCLLVMGMTMYYRSILLDAPWWPLTEAFVNVAMFLLYMAAGIVYLNDLNRGGLCYMTIGVNPIVAHLCRVDGGQMAGTAFIYINMTLYLGSFLVCLKMWRHEAARRHRVYLENRPQEELEQSIPLKPQKPKRISFKDEVDKTPSREGTNLHVPVRDVHKNPLQKDSASEYTPKVHIVADYIIKYPEIGCVEEREKYKAVFNDQYQEYKDLHRDISTTLSKFRDLDTVMERLLRDGKSDPQRIQSILKTYQEKKSDPAFLEKRERCEYLKAKLSHIKSRIHAFDQETIPSGGT